MRILKVFLGLFKRSIEVEHKSLTLKFLKVLLPELFDKPIPFPICLILILYLWSFLLFLRLFLRLFTFEVRDDFVPVLNGSPVWVQMMSVVKSSSMVDVDDKCGYLNILIGKEAHVYGVKLRPIDHLQMCGK